MINTALRPLRLACRSRSQHLNLQLHSRGCSPRLYNSRVLRRPSTLRPTSTCEPSLTLHRQSLPQSQKGTVVVVVGSRGAWRSVQYRGRAGWVSSRYVSRERPVLTSAPRPLSPVAQRRAARAVPENPRKGQPVRQGAYGQGCDCPYDRMRNGRRCGGNSAWSRPGGRSPKCYW